MEVVGTALAQKQPIDKRFLTWLFVQSSDAASQITFWLLQYAHSSDAASNRATLFSFIEKLKEAVDAKQQGRFVAEIRERDVYAMQSCLKKCSQELQKAIIKHVPPSKERNALIAQLEDYETMKNSEERPC